MDLTRSLTRQFIAMCFLAALTILPALTRAEPIKYNYFDASYGAQSTININGGSFDSDDSYALGGGALVLDNLFLWGRFSSAGYDLTGYHDNHGNYPLTNNDFTLMLGSAGAGYRTRISPDDWVPVDFFASLSYELNETKQRAKPDKDDPASWDKAVTYDSSKTWNGAGLKLGVKAAVTERITLSADAYEVSYGSQLLARKGGLDGLSFELEAAVEVAPHFNILASYVTGELDYKELQPLTTQKEVEVDRDQFWLGLRYAF
jgi:hypothetical protein